MGSYRFLCLSVLALTSCTDGIGPSVIDGKLTVGNGLIDMGVRPVGSTSTTLVKVTATIAGVQVTDASTLNIEGDYFSVTGRVFLKEAPETEEDIVSLDEVFRVRDDASAWIEVAYTPTAKGYHRARLVISHTGLGFEAAGMVRAQAADPGLSVHPYVLDFGDVPQHETRQATFTVVNDSQLDMELSQLLFEGGQGFSSVEAYPVTVASDAQVTELSVAYTAPDDFPTYGTAKLLVGDTVLHTFTLRANDCENGIPDAYDLDLDGFTSCGGDCDDTNPHAHPGGVETIVDGADNDCNGLVDDHTLGYDDDGDGYCDHPAICIEADVLPGDCNDYDALVNPGEDEFVGDGIDNDCDGGVDGDSVDYDGDGYSEAAGDCEPTDATSFPGAWELADGIDNDCDLIVDEGTALYDDDGDGYCEGLPGQTTPCTDGTLLGDCDDTTDRPSFPGSDSYPGADELEDGIDNDCDGSVDEGTTLVDDDGDGYAEAATPSDCNDDNPNIGPSSLEVTGNGVDDDCDPSTPD